MSLRYPNIHHFRGDQAEQFFGRDKEVEALLRLLKVEAYGLLFAKAGIGKTSLLQAGLIPELNKLRYYPIYVDFTAESGTPIEVVLKTLVEEAKKKGLEQKITTSLALWGNDKPVRLWDYLKAFDLALDNEDITPVLILDGFEHIFDHKTTLVEAFVESISDLLYQRLPTAVQKSIRAIPRRERSLQHMAWMEPLKWKTLFSVQSEYLDQVENLTKAIPTLFNNRYQLKAFDFEQAKDALVLPAALVDPSFDTPYFEYAPEILTAIFNGLADHRGEIDPFQLQIIAHHIELQVQKMKTTESVTIPLAFLEAFGGVEEILSNNYYQQILKEELSGSEYTLATHFLEEGLIVGGKLISLAAPIAETQFNITPKLITKLLKVRLIRFGRTHLGRTYELSHDNLAKPIFEAYQERQQAEYQLELKKAEEKAEEKREKEARKFRAKIKKQRQLLISFTSLIVLLIGTSITTWYYRSEAAELRKKHTYEQYRLAYEKAIGFHFISNEYDEAKLLYQVAIDYAEDLKDLGDTVHLMKMHINYCDSMSNNHKNNFRLLVSKAEHFRDENQLDSAVAVYEQVLDDGYNNTRLWEIIEEFSPLLEKALEESPNDTLQHRFLLIHERISGFYKDLKPLSDLAYKKQHLHLIKFKDRLNKIDGKIKEYKDFKTENK
ncbi:MAG: ATP-binding protein [Aureispira sp.]|nr:ATP-binding protein [Aureispira sp.]